MKQRLLSPQKILTTLLLLLFVQLAGAQNFQLILNNNFQTNNGSAPQGHLRWVRTCFLVTASEMATSGATASQVFNYLRLNQNVPATFGATGTVNIYLQNTTDATYLKSATWPTLLTGMSQVTSSSFTLPTVAGAYTINYNMAPFTYTGGAMYVALEYSNPVGTLSSTLTAHLVNTVLTSHAVRSQATTNVPPTALALTASRPDLQMGFQYTNDVAVKNIYTLGKLPIEYGTPTTIRANITNAGTNPMANITVNMSVSGANTFSGTQLIPTLLPGASAVVSFPGYVPTSLSTGDIVAVSVSAPGDQNGTNDILTWSQDVTQNVYTYKNPALANNGGVGFNGGTGDFVAKFNSHAGTSPLYINPPLITELKVDLTTSGQPYQLGIWDASGPGGTPGVNLWTSPALTSSVGTSFIAVPSVAVNGDYFVGVRQTGTTNVGFAYQTESPIRSGTFYYTAPTGGTTWTDFAPNSPFRFSIEVTVHIPVPPNCAINFSPADASSVTCTNPVLTWAGGGGSPTGYDVYFSSNSADVNSSSPSALVSTNQPGTSYTPTGLTAGGTYYWKIVPRNSDGAATGCGMQSFTTGSLPNCYCIPTYTGTLCTGAITNVTFNTLNNSTLCTAPGHAIFTPTGTNTTSVQQGSSYNLSVTTDSTDIISVWIDYDQNGTLDASEWTQVTIASASNVASVVSVPIPATALLGNTLMRVRSRFSNNANGSGDACTTFGSGSSKDFVITITGPLPCAGTPNPGNTLASATSVCAGATVNFSLQNPTAGTGVTYQWNNNGGPITGATNSTYSTLITVTDDFYCDVNCGGNIGTSNLVSVNLNPFYNCYCTSIPGFTADEEIYNVTVNGGSTDPLYANANGCSTVAPGPGSILNTYSNFKTIAPITSVTQGTTVPFTIVEDECDGVTYFSNGIAIWIDFNQNGSFADPGEQVFVEPTTTVSPRTVNGNITIPTGALTGQTVMRIICAEGFSGTGLTPCMTYNYGETEDHMINILPTIPCSGTPAPGNTIASASSACPNTTVNLSLQNQTTGSGVTYQWYNGAGAITGATNNFYLATITSADNFHCDVTCSSSTGSSTPVAISLNPYTACYCPAGATAIGCTTLDEYVGNVTFNTINNSSTCPVSGQYTDFSSISTTVTQGNSYTASVLIPNWFAGDQAAVWFDFDHDGILNDVSERFLLTAGGTSGTDPFTGSITIPVNASLGATKMRVRGNYTGTMSSCGIANFGEVEDYTVNIVANNSILNLKCYIEGYWDNGSNAMKSVLANQGVTAITGACDSIVVELRDSASPYSMAYSTQALLMQNGTAVCTFPPVSGSYYIAVKHRNAIQTWSANPVTIGAVTSYDFSTAASQAYGSSLQQTEVSPGIFGFWSGDIAIDENMDLLDLGLVETDISEFVFGYYYDPSNSNYPLGVIGTDLNGDGNVDLLDGGILENNISNFIFSSHP